MDTLQGFKDQRGANSSLCVPDEDPSSACEVKNCAVCRASPFDCFRCKPVRIKQCRPSPTCIVGDTDTDADTVVTYSHVGGYLCGHLKYTSSVLKIAFS